MRQREGEKEKEIYFKELAHMIVKAWQDSHLQGRPREELQFESKSRLVAEFLLGFCSLKAFKLLDEAHPHYRG